MSLASTDDVRRVLKDDTIDDDEIEPYLEAASEWVRKISRNFDADGSVTESFYLIRPGDIVVVHDANPIVTEVKYYLAASLTGDTQSEGIGFYVLDGGRIRTGRFWHGVPLENIRPEWRTLPYELYDRVDVIYTASSVVPAPVREAVALIAASGYINSDTSDINDSDLTSEHIGDYSYNQRTKAGTGTGRFSNDKMPARARQYLRPYIRPKARSV